MTSRHVKGQLFADYVRMIRRRKDVDWSARLTELDLTHVAAKIDPDGWYPMEVFERLGNAILAEIANGDVQAVRMWGRFSVQPLVEAQPTLLAPNDPLESLMRFHVMRSTFFDFSAIEVQSLSVEHAELEIHYYMGPTAEEAAAFQAMGFFEGLLALASANVSTAKFSERSWAGDRRTILSLTY
jgi:hypothetical protein